MNFTHTFSRSKLQAIPAERRLQAIVQYVDSMSNQVTQAAAAGKTSCLHQVAIPNKMGSYAGQYILNQDDVIEGLKAKFPDCSIYYAEEWVDIRPGVREERKGIRIDWS